MWFVFGRVVHHCHGSPALLLILVDLLEGGDIHRKHHSPIVDSREGLVAFLLLGDPGRTALLYFASIAQDRVVLQVVLCEIVLQILPIVPLKEFAAEIVYVVHCGLEVTVFGLFTVGLADVCVIGWVYSSPRTPQSREQPLADAATFKY